MEKIIKAGEYEFTAKSTAASLISYKANFGRDGLRDLISLTRSMSDGDNIDIESFDLDVFFRFLWVFAKAGDKDIPPLEVWLDSFDIPPLDFVTEVFPQVVDMLSQSVGGTVKPKKRRAAAGVKK